jgi:hypothetical protein
MGTRLCGNERALHIALRVPQSTDGYKPKNAKKFPAFIYIWLRPNDTSFPSAKANFFIMTAH